MADGTPPNQGATGDAPADEAAAAARGETPPPNAAPEVATGSEEQQAAGGPGGEPDTAGAHESPLSSAQAADEDAFTRRPELFVGAAFVGGVLAAQLLKRFGE